MDKRRRTMEALLNGYMGVSAFDEYAAKIAVEALSLKGWDVYRIGRDVLYRPRPENEENAWAHNFIKSIKTPL